MLGERSGVIKHRHRRPNVVGSIRGLWRCSDIGNLWIARPVGRLAGGWTHGLIAGLHGPSPLKWIGIHQEVWLFNILAVGLTGYFYVSGLTTKGKFPAHTAGAVGRNSTDWPGALSNPPMTHWPSSSLRAVLHALGLANPGGRRASQRGHTVGINVFRMRYINVIIAGAIAGLAEHS